MGGYDPVSGSYVIEVGAQEGGVVVLRGLVKYIGSSLGGTWALPGVLEARYMGALERKFTVHGALPLAPPVVRAHNSMEPTYTDGHPVLPEDRRE